MREIFFLLFVSTLLSSSVLNMSSFKADFSQVITDDKGKKLSYNGHIVASKPQYALWSYKNPIKKDVYMTPYSITVIEPDIEQAIVRKIASNFDFFNIIQKAKRVSDTKYIATINSSKYTIILENSVLESISYLDEFENSVTISFDNQEKNIQVSKSVFTVNIPAEYDIIRD